MLKKYLFPAVVLLLIGTVGYKVYSVGTSPSAEEHSESERQQASGSSFDKKKRSISDPASNWVVVNKQRPLNPKEYASSDLVDVGGGEQMRQEAAEALKEMMKTSSAAGFVLQPLSGYRSYATQQVVYSRQVASIGQEAADRESARPGHSEHQTGLAIDVGGGGCGIEDCFGNTPQGKWVAAHAHEFGFIIRYVPGKEDITGYRPEPWHIRYVGKELAAEMKKQKIQTLEEFFNL